MKTLKQLREEYDSKYVSQDSIPEEMVLEAKSKSLMRGDVPSPTQMPALLLFRRISYRLYPHNQVVALYYSKMVDKYLSVPFGPTGNLNLSEASVYDTLEELDIQEGAKWDTAKGAIKGALYGAVKGAAIGNAVAAGPGAVVGGAVGGVRGAIKGAKTVKESFSERCDALREQKMDEGLGDYVEAGRSYVEKKIKSSPTASKYFKKVQDFGHKLPGYENVKAAKEKAGKGDWGGAAWETAKSLGKAALTGAGAAALVGAAAVTGGKGDDVRAQTKSASTELKREKPTSSSKSSWKKSGDPVLQSKLKTAELKQASTVKENKISDLRKMIDEGYDNMSININGRPITLNTSMTKRILEVYDSVNTKNKKIVESMLNEDLESFKKLLNFSIRK